jgi:hypothetical protein
LKKKRKPGYPKKKGNLASDDINIQVKPGGHPSALKDNVLKSKSTPKATNKANTNTANEKKKPPVKCTNWSLLENKEKMEKAVAEWVAKKG